MDPKYSYDWYIQAFQQAKESAEQFILTTEETQFIQPPAEGRWSGAECYSHLIRFGKLYLQNMEPAVEANYQAADDVSRAFQPRWIFQKVILFFEPPYNIKLKTLKPMKPEPVTEYNRVELLDKYINLQDRFIAQLEKGRKQQTDLQAVKVEHPVFSVIKMTLSECFAIAEAHQRRHQWQAKQTIAAVKESNSRGNNLSTPG